MENLAIKPFRENRLFSFRLSPAVWLTLIYLTLSISWIIGSDRLAKNISGNNIHLFEQIQAVKGLVFVGLSSAILFLICRKFYNDLLLSFRQTKTLQDKYDAVNEASHEGIFDCDLVNMTARMNNKMQFFFPIGSNEVDNFWEKFKTRMHPGDVKRLYEEFDKVLSSGKTDWQLEYQLLGNDNKYYTVISHVYIIRGDKTGKVTRLIGSLQDVTELRNLQAEYYEERLKNEQRLASSVIAAQERERDRWARELHDNVCQILGVVKLFASEVKPANEESAKLIGEIDKLVLKALNEIRQLSCNIKPPAFTEMTLTESVQTLVANVNRFKKFEFALHAEHFDEEQLTDEQKLLVYRVIQEQLNNIVKYAKAQKVIATLSSDKADKMHITVQDNGIGFDTSEIKTGIGLRNIANRVQAFKGYMNVRSSPGAGCTLTASFSL